MRIALAASAALLTLTTTACFLSGDDGGFAPVAAPQVALRASGLDGPVRLGLLVSATSPAGEGSELLAPAAGARVAQYRFAQGGAEVALDVHDDKGTSDGAAAGVRAMVAGGVSGIVAATSGPHLDAALREAAAANVPVLLPYERRTVTGATSSWFTGPAAADVRTGLAALLSRQELRRPFVLYGDGAGAEVTGLANPADTAAIRSGQSPPAAVAPVLAALAARRVDSVVVAASATTQAALVAELQGRAKDLPIVLSPAALAPAFGDGLANRLSSDGSATPFGRFLTVGPRSVDASAHAADEEATALAAFLAANRLTAQAPAVQAITHPVAFGEKGAATADTAAHDAVVALVRAAEKAESAAPGAVADALGTLALGGADGLAGPRLDFTSRQAFAGDGLAALASTSQDPGMRTGVGEARPAVSWFVLPADG